MAAIQATTGMSTVQQMPTADNAVPSAAEKELKEECARLREALAQIETERNWYRKALYEHARASREFEDLDLATLQSISAGPVEEIK
jgi:hypothetical protein